MTTRLAQLIARKRRVPVGSVPTREALQIMLARRPVAPRPATPPAPKGN
jgi:hypothetical protein